jgi:hypothetical protein
LKHELSNDARINIEKKVKLEVTEMFNDFKKKINNINDAYLAKMHKFIDNAENDK